MNQSWIVRMFPYALLETCQHTSKLKEEEEEEEKEGEKEEAGRAAQISYLKLNGTCVQTWSFPCCHSWTGSVIVSELSVSWRPFQLSQITCNLKNFLRDSAKVRARTTRTTGKSIWLAYYVIFLNNIILLWISTSQSQFKHTGGVSKWECLTIQTCYKDVAINFYSNI